MQRPAPDLCPPDRDVVQLDRERSARFAHRIRGVGREIEQHLVDLRRITLHDRRIRPHPRHDRHPERQCGAHQVHGFLDDRAQGGVLLHAPALAAQGEETGAGLRQWLMTKVIDTHLSFDAGKRQAFDVLQLGGNSVTRLET